MGKEEFKIRDLCFKDIPAAMQLVMDEGWNQTENDWKLFLNNPLNSCKCVELNGKLIGTTTSYNFSNEVAWISMVLVNKKFRGLGISKLLLNSVLEDLKNVPSIKLDATEAGKNVYKKFGFIEEYRISRMIVNSFTFSKLLSTGNPLITILPSEIYSVIDFDKSVFGVQRQQLIRSWISTNQKNNLVVKSKNKIIGFALGRQGTRFYQIGPVSSKSEESAITLISTLLQNLNANPIVLDVMDNKAELINWLTSIGFERKRGFTRMYFKANTIPQRSEYQFAIGGPEFG